CAKQAEPCARTAPGAILPPAERPSPLNDDPWPSGTIPLLSRNAPPPASWYTMMGPQELARLIDRQGPALTLYARQWCEAPEDVVQQAFLDLVTQPTPPREVTSWLYRVVRNGAIDAARSDRRRQHREAEAARAARWFVEPEVDGLDAEVAV